MTTPFQQETAKIYQFRPRAELLASTPPFSVKTHADTTNFKVIAPLCGDSWYHEAAIQAKDNSRKS